MPVIKARLEMANKQCWFVDVIINLYFSGKLRTNYRNKICGSWNGVALILLHEPSNFKNVDAVINMLIRFSCRSNNDWNAVEKKPSRNTFKLDMSIDG